MKTLALALTLGATVLGAGVASAQPVPQRQIGQETRIHQGVASGQITRREAHQLQRQQRSIAHEEHRMRAQNGGYLRPGQRARLEARQNRASTHIYAARHNDRVG